jgi:hypothetical protein
VVEEVVEGESKKLKLAFSPTLPSLKLYPLAPVQEILEPAVSPTAIAVEL